MAEHIGWDAERLEFLWGLKQPSPRGPRPSLTGDQIVRAAIELADAEGLKAVSMKRVAERLDVGTMSLYTYVPDKASLLYAMTDTVAGEADLGDPADGWRPYLEQLAGSVFDVYMDHPWMLEVPIDGPPVAPNQVAYMEGVLEALESTGLEDEEKIDVIMAISSFVRGAADVAVGITRMERDSGLTWEEIEARHATAFRRVLTPDRFPRAAALLTWADPGQPDQGPREAFVHFGLRRLLDGLESLIAQRATSGR